MRYKILLTALFVSSILGASAQRPRLELTVGYNAGLPTGEMRQTTGTLNAVNLAVFYTPNCPHMQQCPLMSRMSLGLELNGGNYASFTKTQLFGFNGTETPTDVHYNSSVSSVNLMLRFQLLKKGPWEIAAGPKFGITTFQSQLQIEDPADQEGCKALETDNLIKDRTWQAGGSASVTMDTKAIFPRIAANRFLVQAHAGCLHGGNVDYINVQNRGNETDMSQMNADNNGTPLNMQFVNVTTNEQHQHEVARVYTSPVKYFEAGISLVVRF